MSTKQYMIEAETKLREAALQSHSPMFRGTYEMLANCVNTAKTPAQILVNLPKKQKGESMVTEMARNITRAIKAEKPFSCL